MAQYPPPGPPPPPASGGATRPGVVTAAGVLLIIAGAFNILGGIILLGLNNIAAFYKFVGVLSLGLGALALYAGIQVFALKERGRQIGVVLAAIAAVVNLLQIARVPASAVIGIAFDAFIIWALTQNRQYFTN